MTITGVDLTQGNIQTKPFSPVDIFVTTLAELPDPAEHEGALVYIAGTGLLLSDGTAWNGVAASSSLPDFGLVNSDYKYQAFAMQIINNGGTLQHKVAWVENIPMDISSPAGLIDRFNGFTTTAVNTPTGTDSTTAFANGAKISSGNASYVILDTINDQDDGLHWWRAEVIAYTTSVRPSITFGSPSANVNGVTKSRPYLIFYNGTAFNLNTTNIGNGQYITFIVQGFFK